MTFQVGDLVRVHRGEQYTYTDTGSVGIVVGGHPRYPAILFTWLPARFANMDDATWELEGGNLEHVVGDIDPEKMVANGFAKVVRQLTASGIQGLLSCKLETAAKVAGVVDALKIAGLVVTDENFAGIRDDLRMSHQYFKSVYFHDGVSPDTPEEDKFLHVSKCKTMVSYAASPEKHSADVWTTMKYGRYLTKFHPSMSNEQVKEAVDAFNAEHGIDVKVLFGGSQGDFIRAINEGPSESCMQGLAFKGHIHPAAVYAAGDITVAWMETGSRITARTLINASKLLFSRVYGDEAKLKPALEALGYSQQVGALVGCRLLKIPNQNGDGHIMAYVDAGVGSGGGSLKFEDAGDHWELTDSGGRDTYVGYEFGGTTDGCSEDDEIDCGRCGYSADEDELTWIESEDRSVCPDCLGRHYTNVRTRGGDWFYAPDGDMTYIDCLGYSVLTEDIDEFDVVEDEYRGEWIKLDESIRTYDNDEWIHEEDAIAVGTNSDGTMFIHESAVKKYIADGRLYTNASGDKFHEDSDEIQTWVDGVDQEGWDESEYTKLVVEAVAEPVVVPNAVKGAGATFGPLMQETLSQTADTIVLTANPTFTTAANWSRSVQAFEPAPATEILPNHIRTALLKMQEGGIQFTYSGSVVECTFMEIASKYKIDHSVKPENWVELLKAAQDAGVRFTNDGYSPQVWHFTDVFEYYQLAP